MQHTYTGLFKFSPKKNSSVDGFVSHDKDVIKKSIETIIKTHKGSRVYDPDFGTNLCRLIFEQNLERTRNIAKSEITEIITKYEPRALISNISIFPNSEKSDEAVLVLTIQYVEYGDEEIMQMVLKTDTAWENADKAAGAVINDFYKK